MPQPGLARLIGRDDLFEHLKQRLCSGGDLALSAINGLPGIGKTALAISLASDPQVQARFCDGILWAGLGTKPNVLGLLTRWGILLGVSPGEAENSRSLQAWGESLRMSIGKRSMLLVIDDVWQLDAALALQVGGYNCAHLLTTRFPQIAYDFAAEGAMKVPELSDVGGVALLARFIPDLVAREPEETLLLVRQVGALPLALTLMGRYLASQAYHGHPRRLQQALDQLHNAKQRLSLTRSVHFIERSPSLPVDTSLSLHATIAVSDHYLDPADRAALYALSVFPAKPNTFSEDAALAVCQTSVETLDRLSDAGLLESSLSDRYTLHQTIADYARLQLKEDEPLKRMSTYYVIFLEEHSKQYETLEMEQANVLAVLEAAVERGWQSELIRGCIAFAPFLRTRGLYALAEIYLQQAYQAAVALDDSVSVASLLLHQGDFAEIQGEYAQAETCLLEGLKHARQRGDLQQVCAALASLGLVTRRLARYSDAEAYLQEGLSLAQQIADVERTCTILKNLASIAGEQGNYTMEQAYALQGLSLARQWGLLDRIPDMLVNLGASISEQGNDRQAEAYYQEGLALACQRGNRPQICLLLTNLGWIAAKQEDYVRAEAYLREGLALAQQTGNREQTILLLINLGSTFGVQNNHAEAMRCYNDGLTLARQINHQRWISLLLTSLAVEASKQGDVALAEQYYQEGIALARQVASHRMVSDMLLEWGEEQLKQHRFEAAAKTLYEVQERAAGKEQDILAQAHYLLARIAVSQSYRAQAQRLGRESLRIFEEIDHPKTTELRTFLASLPSEIEKTGDI